MTEAAAKAELEGMGVKLTDIGEGRIKLEGEIGGYGRVWVGPSYQALIETAESALRTAAAKAPRNG